MIYFNINLRKPSWWDRFENIKSWHGPAVLKNKYWEVQVCKTPDLLRIEVEFTIKQDHAGLNVELGLLGYQISLTVYDCRHWDDETNTYKVYND